MENRPDPRRIGLCRAPRQPIRSRCHARAALLGIPFAATLPACGEPTPDEIGVSGTSGAINVTSTTFYEDGGGVDETGDGGEPQVVNGCLMEPHPQGIQGFQHQCDGTDFLTVSFEAVGVAGHNGPHSFNLALQFGSDVEDDSYAKPKVMACCEPFDEETPVWEQEHHRACYHDMIENGCGSITSRILELKKDAPFIVHAQIDSLATWFADHTNDCYKEFWLESGASTFASDWFAFPDGSHTWVLPSSAETLNMKDIELTLTEALIFDPFLPLDVDDRILCDSAKDNNGVVFLEAEPDPSGTYELQTGDIELEGTYQSTLTTASADLASAAVGCEVCSLFGFTAAPASGGPKIDALVLDSEDPADIRWSPATLAATHRFRVALYDDVPAPLVSSRHWQIAEGEAHFVGSGIGQAGWGALSMYNSTKIDIWYVTSTGQYEIDPFEIEYVDASSETWTVSVSETTWD